MQGQVAIIGLGIFGREIATSLSQRGFSVLAADRDEYLVEEIKDQVTQARILDAANEHALAEIHIGEFETVVNAIGTEHMESSILVTALLKQFGVARIIARATTPLHARILRQVGAHQVVNPEEDLARKLARQIARPGLRDILELSEGVSVAEIPVPSGFVGKTLEKLDVRRRHNVNVIGVRRGGGGDARARLILSLSPRDDMFREEDALVVIGRDADVDRLAQLG